MSWIESVINQFSPLKFSSSETCKLHFPESLFCVLLLGSSNFLIGATGQRLKGERKGEGIPQLNPQFW